MNDPTLQIWAGDLSSIDDDAALALLNADELQRARRLLVAEKAHEFACARATLRLLLARITGQAPAALHFTTAEHGKPVLADHPQLCFNLSHSQQQLLIAVNKDGIDVGADIEVPRAIDVLPLAQRYFASSEIELLKRTPATELQHVFFRIWTRKEACVKACGGGIRLGLDSFAVNGAEQAAIVQSSDDINPDGTWCIVDCSSGYLAAIVACAPIQITRHAIMELWQQN